MSAIKNFTKFRLLSLGTSATLLLWYFFDIDFSKFNALKQIPNTGESVIALILSGLLLFFVSEITFGYSKIKHIDGLKQDIAQFIIAFTISLSTLFIIYPKLVKPTFLAETSRYDVLFPLILSSALGFMAIAVSDYLQFMIVFVRLRKTILPSIIGYFFVLISIITLIIFLHYKFTVTKIEDIFIFNNIIFLLGFICTYFILSPKEKLLDQDNYDFLSRLSDSLDRSLEMSESDYPPPPKIWSSTKGQHKEVMRYINKMSREDNKNLKVKFKTCKELSLSFFGENLQINSFDKDQILVSAIFYDWKTQKVHCQEDISYKYIKLSLDELNKDKVFKGMKDVTKILNNISLKALEILKKDKSDQNVKMFLLVQDGTVEQLKEHFSKSTIQIDYQIENGYTALNLSVANGAYEKAQYLLQKAADPNIPNKLGVTPLGFAARYGKKELCKLLLDYGADINYQTPECRTTSLIKAAQHGHSDVVKLLIDNNAKIELTDRENKNAVEHATQMHYGEIAKMLKKSLKKS